MAHAPDVHEDDLAERGYDRALVVRSAAYLRPHLKLAGVSAAFLLLVIASELALPLIVRGTLDGPIAAKDAARLPAWVALFGAAMLAQGLARMGENLTTNLLGQRIVRDLRNRLFEHLQTLSLAWFDRNPVGRLVTRVTNDIEAVKELFTSGFITAGYEVLLMLGIVGMMCAVEPRLAAVAMACVPAYLVTTLIFRKTAN